MVDTEVGGLRRRARSSPSAPRVPRVGPHRRRARRAARDARHADRRAAAARHDRRVPAAARSRVHAQGLRHGRHRHHRSAARSRLGDELVAWPRGVTARVRGLEVHGVAVERARAGQRCAVNLGGVAVDELARGDVLAHPGAVAPSHLLDVRFRHVAAARGPLPPRSKVLVHHGTTQVEATLVLVGDAALAPGAEGFAQLRIDRGHAAGRAARRSLHRARLPAAGRSRHHPRRRRGDPGPRRQGPRHRITRPSSRASPPPAPRSASPSRSAPPTPPPPPSSTWAAAPATAAAELATRLANLIAAGELLRAGDGDTAVYLHAEVVATLEQALLARLDEAARATPAPPRAAARGAAPEAPRRPARPRLRRRRRQRGPPRRHRDHRRPGPPPQHHAAPRPLTARSRARHPLHRLGPRAAAAQGARRRGGRPEAAVKQAVDQLLAARVLTKVKPDYFVDAATLAALEARLRDYLAAHREITPQAWKDLTNTSRKYSIPLAEYFDAAKVTLRVGDNRRLR